MTASLRSERDPIRWMTSGSATVVDDAEARIERLVRILVDDLHAPPQRTEVGLREARDVDAVEGDASRVRVDQPQDRLRGRGLAATGLAHERDHLATPDRQRDAGHRMHEPLRPTQDRPAEAAGDAVADDEIVDLEERAAVRFELRHATTSTELAK